MIIVEITPQALVDMFRTDNLIHVAVTDGIPRTYEFVKAAINPDGNIELSVESEYDELDEKKSITVVDLTGT